MEPSHTARPSGGARRGSRRARNDTPRPHRIKFRVDDQELAVIAAAAGELDMALGAYAATATLARARTGAAPAPDAAALLRRLVSATSVVTQTWRVLRTVGGLLNQVAAVGNSTGALPPETGRVIAQVARVSARVDDAVADLRALTAEYSPSAGGGRGRGAR